MTEYLTIKSHSASLDKRLAWLHNFYSKYTIISVLPGEYHHECLVTISYDRFDRYYYICGKRTATGPYHIIKATKNNYNTLPLFFDTMTFEFTKDNMADMLDKATERRDKLNQSMARQYASQNQSTSTDISKK